MISGVQYSSAYLAQRIGGFEGKRCGRRAPDLCVFGFRGFCVPLQVNPCNNMRCLVAARVRVRQCAPDTVTWSEHLQSEFKTSTRICAAGTVLERDSTSEGSALASASRASL